MTTRIFRSESKFFTGLVVCSMLFLSACGRDPYIMVDFAGQNLAEADTLLEDAGLRASVEDLSGNGRQVMTSENWTIIEQVPEAGTEVRKNDPLNFGILKNDEVGPGGPLQIKVPDFTGMTLGEATERGKSLGVSIEAFTPGSDSSVIKWLNSEMIVVDQEVSAGASFIKARTINLTVDTPENLMPQFSDDMVRAKGKTKRNNGGQANVRFVAGTSNPDELSYLTEQCIDHFLEEEDAAFCYGYKSDEDYDVKDEDWTPASDEDVWGGARPCWATYGGQPLSGREWRLDVRVVPDPC